MAVSTDEAVDIAYARFNELTPYQSQHAQGGIPSSLMEQLTAHRVFPVASPPGLVGRNASAHVRSWPGLSISIAQCTPRQGPVAHNHMGTLETFFCLDGRFDIVWGNQLEHSLTVQAGDLVSVPPGNYRAFRNLTEDNARLFVLIQGDRQMSDKISMPRYVGEKVSQEHGQDMVDRLAAINMRFEGDDLPELTQAEMRQRFWQIDGKGVGRHAVMSAPGAQPEAPVRCWPGLNVWLSVLDAQPCTDIVPADHLEWVVNAGEGPLQLALDGEASTLNRFDLVRLPAGTRYTVTAPAEGGRLLVARQGRDTIEAP